MWNRIHVEMDYDAHTANGMSKMEAVREISKEWTMTLEEVLDIITIYEIEMNDIDHTGDLGEIL
jgi:hypothetical protein